MDERRIALAAILVSGFVSVGVAFFSWRTTVDTTRTSAANERKLHDLDELRKVVDDVDSKASAEVEALFDFFFMTTRLADGIDPDLEQHEQEIQRLYDAYKEKYRDASHAVFRLEVRLGAKHRITTGYRYRVDVQDGRANGVMAVARRIMAEGTGGRDGADLIDEMYNAAGERVPDPKVDVRKEVHQLLRSELP